MCSCINFRKERHKERIKKVIAYAEEARCRSQQLLALFWRKRKHSFAEPVMSVLDVQKQRVSSDEYEIV